MMGYVNGFPAKVPTADAMTLPRNTSARVAARSIWHPRNGVKIAKTPAAQPSAMLCGVALIRQSRRIM